MVIIRPIQESDLDQLMQIAQKAGVGMTSLPADEVILSAKIKSSLDSLKKEVSEPLNESYLFVMEDVSQKKIVGTSGIISCVGTQRPFYSYKILKLVQMSDTLKIQKDLQALHLVNDYQGVTEICTLFLDPSARKKGRGTLLSRSRFLMMAEFPERFRSRVIAEMRGVQDEDGKSPFWRNLGRHFFEMDFSRADFLTATGNGAFITELMPRYPIYICLLPQEAQNVIGEVHQATVPALEMLKNEGFRFEGYVDIFDAGPTIQCDKSSIRSVRESRQGVVEHFEELEEGLAYLISNSSLDFRASLGKLKIYPDHTVSISRRLAELLNVGIGDCLRYVPLNF